MALLVVVVTLVTRAAAGRDDDALVVRSRSWSPSPRLTRADDVARGGPARGGGRRAATCGQTRAVPGKVAHRLRMENRPDVADGRFLGVSLSVAKAKKPCFSAAKRMSVVVVAGLC